MYMFIHRFFICCLMALFFFTSSLVPAARAAVIDTSAYLDQALTPGQLGALIDRQDIQASLVKLGVDPEDAHNRIRSLSQAELREMQDKIDDLPAGSSLLAVLGALLVVLIVLEMVGVTNVFSQL